MMTMEQEEEEQEEEEQEEERTRLEHRHVGCWSTLSKPHRASLLIVPGHLTVLTVLTVLAVDWDWASHP